MIKNYSYEASRDENGIDFKNPRRVIYEKGSCKYSTASGYDDISFKAVIRNESTYEAFQKSKYFNFFMNTYLIHKDDAHIKQTDKLVLLWLAFCYKATATATVDYDGKDWASDATWHAGGILKYRNAPVQVTLNTHILTMNSHGAKSNNMTLVPPLMYVYIPHHLGLSQNYTVAPCVSTFEKIMYENNEFIDFKHGKTIYGPGEEISNLRISPFGVGDAAGGGAAACNAMTNTSWLPEIRMKMLECVNNNETACIIPVTQHVSLEWIAMPNRFKIKICGPTTLEQIFATVQYACKNRDLSYCNSTIIMPMCCNAGTGKNAVLTPTAVPIPSVF